jgi:hypothetical protein
MNKKKLIFSIIFMLMFFPGIEPVTAQQEKEAAAENADKLRQKLLLSDEQTSKLTEILAEYFEDPDEENLNSAMAKTESLLNEKQKVKYDIIKNDLWNSVKKKARSLQQE